MLKFLHTLERGRQNKTPIVNDVVHPTTNGNVHASPIPANEDTHARLGSHIHIERHMKIICIGAGASGLLLAYKLQRSFQNFELVLYDKNEQIAGTWFENKYPGCACDIPAHTYTWSFEPKADWSSVYAGSDEILKYFEGFAAKYDLHKYCKLRHQVTSAVWNESTGGWDVEVSDLSKGTTVHDRCDILINASGVLNAWKWPVIPGLHDFNGALLHTANYDRSVDLTGKHVGLIGNGSSAIQVLPAIHPVVSKVTTFVRRATWVSPTQGFEPHTYTEEEVNKFETDPQEHIKYRKQQETRTNSIFPMFLEGSEVQKMMFATMVGQMKEKLDDKNLEEKLIPQYGVGCRRITPGVNYLETLGADNVEVVYGEIERITEKGVLSANGKEYELDVLICATGFDVSFKPRFALVGSGGKNLAEDWAEEAKCYIGMAAAGYPNYFTVVGPNSPIGNGPVLCFIESQIDYMLKFANRWQTENIHSFSPKIEAIEDFIAHKDQFMKKTVWQHDCRSWYKNNSISGKVSALWPGSTLHYMEAISDVRYEDWNIAYSGNRFAFLGNGFSQTEIDPTADWAYYIRNQDDSPYLGRGKNIRMVNKSGTISKAPPVTLYGK